MFENFNKRWMLRLRYRAGTITRDEKIQTAKSILLFLSYINDSHLNAYLSEVQLLEIEKWKSEEDSWVSSLA